MPKYRLLTLDELLPLQKEFIEYLILNGIAAEEWESLKKEDKAGADKIIELFSDVVLETILRKVNFLELRERAEVKTFQCLSDKLVVVAMRSNDREVNFVDSSYIINAITNPPASIKVYTLEKVYSKQRELELFDMIQTGCTISDGRLFKQLCLALS